MKLKPIIFENNFKSFKRIEKEMPSYITKEKSLLLNELFDIQEKIFKSKELLQKEKNNKEMYKIIYKLSETK